MRNVSLEFSATLYDDNSGDKIFQVFPDTDGMGLISIKQDDKVITFSPDNIDHLYNA